MNNASSLIVAHNHPNTSAEPSRLDRKLTDQLILASELIGIPILDHIIIGNSSFWSFKDNRCHYLGRAGH